MWRRKRKCYGRVRGNTLLLLVLRAHPFCFLPFLRFVHPVPLDLLRQLVLLVHIRALFFRVPRLAF